ncbi:MAG: NYN domain-containing protein [Cytophagales bacterium]|nr:MAG: NYN domain-containing protein [Cytophagales bacterium]TAF60476.1 MAG: NYN domain-containing protein [Cytophagales bacterium]
MTSTGNKLTRIGVFYDGNYFLKVSNYYNYEHPRRTRISIEGLHEFVRKQVAKEENVDIRLCHIVDAHYFRGRLNAYEAYQKSKLYTDRIFDDILMNENIITHYLPLRSRNGKKEEKGIDVSLALEAYELTLYKRFSVVVLIACDGDYVPLIRKLNTLGTRVMLLSWDFKYTDERDQERETRTSQELLEAVTYPLAMHELIDNRIAKNDPLINSLFVSQDAMQTYSKQFANVANNHITPSPGTVKVSTIKSLRNGYGFVSVPPNNLYFSYEDVIDSDFNDLQEGDYVEYVMGKNIRGDCANNVRKVGTVDNPPQSVIKSY